MTALNPRVYSSLQSFHAWSKLIEHGDLGHVIPDLFHGRTANPNVAVPSRPAALLATASRLNGAEHGLIRIFVPDIHI